ncbi:hypothetical protein [Mesobacillus harenae]|uniref:hypothetical protein n=1 Tax=Mesobacillus harenae TaxID=2213203 RepID=UPI001580732C|nr:hypothetical protein [Mesobacillus harenae]
MLYEDYETLARLKREEIEKAAREAWKYETTENEGWFQKALKFVSHKKAAKQTCDPTTSCHCAC